GRPRAGAEVRLRAGQASCAASTAASTSALPAIATSARWLQSCGFKEGSVAPSAAGTNRPAMKSLSWICMALELDRIGLELPALVKLGRSRRAFSHTSSIDRLVE